MISAAPPLMRRCLPSLCQNDQANGLKAEHGLMLMEPDQTKETDAATVNGISVSVAEVRTCLNHLGDSAFLAQSGLAARLAAKKGPQRAAGAAVRQALESAIETLRPATSA